MNLDPLSRQKRVALREGEARRRHVQAEKAKCFSSDPAVRNRARYLATNGTLEGFKP